MHNTRMMASKKNKAGGGGGVWGLQGLGFRVFDGLDSLGFRA